MYHMKNIVNHNEEITLPKCMYHIKNPNESLKDEFEQINVKISNQVPNTKMAELEQRQEQLIMKLDILYDKIKAISSYCRTTSNEVNSVAVAKDSVLFPNEVVLACSTDNLPYYLNKIPKEAVNMNWHIHSSVPEAKVAKILGFMKGLKVTNYYYSNVKLRLIFKNDPIHTELLWSLLSVPIVGTVNILRYLSLTYPKAYPYDATDFKHDSLLDICHLLERAPEKSKETLFKKLFSESKDWVYNNNFSIVDLAAYNLVKQSKGNIKYVPKDWYNKLEM